MSLQYARQSTAPSAIVSNVKTRLREGLELSDSQVRVVVGPNPFDVPFFAEKHISITVSDPKPMPQSGAGRHGYRVYREIQLVVWTTSLLDNAGSDQIALAAHLDYEDLVLDVMIDERPTQLIEVTDPVGVRGYRYTGGQSAQRLVSDDNAMLFSTLNFQLEYVIRTRVNRD